MDRGVGKRALVIKPSVKLWVCAVWKATNRFRIVFLFFEETLL